MIITFCGHSDYLEHKEDENRLLSLLETIANGRHVDFYLGGYENSMPLPRSAPKYTKKLTTWQK